VRRRSSILGVGLAALALAAGGCSGDTVRDVAGSPDPAETTVQEFLDMSLPKQALLIERFYSDYKDKCGNVDLSGASTEFEKRIRILALDRPEDEPVGDLLLSFCEGQGN
jgi:hypothetical protein